MQIYEGISSMAWWDIVQSGVLALVVPALAGGAVYGVHIGNFMPEGLAAALPDFKYGARRE